jgi:thymidylate kinase
MDDVHRPVLITFSGMDGAGKSTQIENLCAWLEARGHSVRRLAFWDDAVVLCRWREGFVHKVFKSERGIGAPGKPVRRRDKNVRKWYLTPIRLALYLLDAINLRRVVARARRSGAGFIIMDRYIYDELANLWPHTVLTGLFVRAIGALAPAPEIAFLLDADPEAAAARKPEYPVEFMGRCRQAYLRLAPIVGMQVVAPLPLEDAMRRVETIFAGSMPDAAESRLDRVSAA